MTCTSMYTVDAGVTRHNAASGGVREAVVLSLQLQLLRQQQQLQQQLQQGIHTRTNQVGLEPRSHSRQ